MNNNVYNVFNIKNKSNNCTIHAINSKSGGNKQQLYKNLDTIRFIRVEI